MQIIIQSVDQLNTFARAVAEHTKLKTTHVKTAIAKARGYQHISALEIALNNNTQTQSPVLATNDSHVMTEFMAWLEDNIECGTDLCFDGDGDVNSEMVYDIMNKVVLINSCVSANAIRIGADLADHQKNIKPYVLASYNVERINDLDDNQYEQTEDALIGIANQINGDPDIAKAIALLEQAGLKGVASEITSLLKTTMELNFLNENT